MFIQVLHEISLGLEFAGQLLGGQVTDASLPVVWIRVLLHAWFVRINIENILLY